MRPLSTAQMWCSWHAHTRWLVVLLLVLVLLLLLSCAWLDSAVQARCSWKPHKRWVWLLRQPWLHSAAQVYRSWLVAVLRVTGRADLLCRPQQQAVSQHLLLTGKLAVRSQGQLCRSTLNVTLQGLQS